MAARGPWHAPRAPARKEWSATAREKAGRMASCRGRDTHGTALKYIENSGAVSAVCTGWIIQSTISCAEVQSIRPLFGLRTA